MKARLLTEGDYDILVDWWKWWRFGVPAKDSLPHDGLGGLMISKDGVDICAGFIFLTNSKTAWCEYIVSNPDMRDRELRDKAIILLINTLSEIAKDKGYKYIYTSLKNKPLIEKYQKCGYIQGSVNCTEMMKNL